MGFPKYESILIFVDSFIETIKVDSKYQRIRIRLQCHIQSGFEVDGFCDSDESQTLSKLNVYDIFAPTTKPMHDVRFEVDF